MDARIQAAVNLWNAHVQDADLRSEFDGLLAPEKVDALYDAFYRNLAFGTAGLRGVLGVGTNRMNVYVVAQATQGVADYLNAHYDHPTLALARDSRNKGEDFQRSCRRFGRQWHQGLCVSAHRAGANAFVCRTVSAYISRHCAYRVS